MSVEIPDFVAIDFETANNHRNSACSIGLTRVIAGAVVASAAFLIRPPTPDFGFYNIKVHGLTWDDVASSPDFGELWPSLAPWFEGVSFIAAHNAPFDRGVLRVSCEHYGVPMPQLPFVDTVRLSRKTFQLPSHTLSSVAEHLGVELNHHEAGSDAHACAQIIISAGSEALAQFL